MLAPCALAGFGASDCCGVAIAGAQKKAKVKLKERIFVMEMVSAGILPCKFGFDLPLQEPGIGTTFLHST
jgi:hypothetical protein